MSKLFRTIEFIDPSIYFTSFFPMSLRCIVMNCLYKVDNNFAKISNPLYAFSAIFFSRDFIYSLLMFPFYFFTGISFRFWPVIFFISLITYYRFWVRDFSLFYIYKLLWRRFYFYAFKFIFYSLSKSNCSSKSAIFFWVIMTYFSNSWSLTTLGLGEKFGFYLLEFGYLT